MHGIRSAILNLPSQQIAEVAVLALGNPDVIPLWFGESDLVTPNVIKDAAKRALDEGRTFYDHANGIKPLRAALKRYLDRIHDIDLDPARICVPGSSMLAIAMAAGMLAQAGDNFVLVAPLWPNVTLSLLSRGVEPRHVRLDVVEGKWRLDLAKVAAAIDGSTKGIFVASPGNPTGWVMSREEQAALLDLVRSRGIGLIADEVYSRLVYDAPAAPSFLEIARADEPVFVINGFSKAWAMTGWRIGWMVAPAALEKRIATLSGIENTGATVFAQYGAVAALEEGEGFVAEMVARCRRGRDLVAARLKPLPNLRWSDPEGAFYAFFALEGVTDSLAFAKDLVRRARVGLAPGSAFGPGNEGFLRLCFAQSPERLSLALDRLIPHFSDAGASPGTGDTP